MSVARTVLLTAPSSGTKEESPPDRKMVGFSPPKRPRKSNAGASSLPSRDPILSKMLIHEIFIGKGSFGKVYEVESESPKKYAIKKIDEPSTSTTRETECLAALCKACNEDDEGASHIVRYYKTWHDRDGLCIQMELCRGLIKDGKLVVQPNLQELLRDLLLALKFIHSKEWCHLDIKPESE